MSVLIYRASVNDSLHAVSFLNAVLVMKLYTAAAF